MSLDLYARETDEALARAPRAPLAQVEGGIFDNFWSGSGRLAMRELGAKPARAISMAIGAQAVVADWAMGGTELQDRWFRQHDDVFGRAVDYWTPAPGEVGVAGEVVGTLAGMLPKIMLSPAYAVGEQVLSQSEDLVRKDAPVEKAIGVGVVQGAGLAAGIWMPILGSTLAQRVLLGGAGFNVVQGVTTRGFSQLILGDDKTAAEFAPLDGKMLTLDVLLGLAFGSWAHVNRGMRVQGDDAWQKLSGWAKGLEPADVDAIAALRQAQHLQQDSMPGIPKEPVDVERHVGRMREALDQLATGREVQVENLPAADVVAEPGHLDEMMARVRELETEGARVAVEEGLPPPRSQNAIPRETIPLSDRAMSVEERAVEERFAQAVAADPAAMVTEYRRRFGNVINTDKARELSLDYNASPDARSRYAAAVHEPASFVAKQVYAQLLAEKPRPGQSAAIVFTAGGTGAGKSTAVDNTPAAAEAQAGAQAVYDTNLNGTESAIKKIDQALAAGKQVGIWYVHADPIDALRRALKRAMDAESESYGRTVPLVEHTATHAGANATIRELALHYADDPRVVIKVIDNTRGPEQAKLMKLAKLPQLEYASLEGDLRSTLDEEYTNGRVSQVVYEGFAGREIADESGIGGTAQARPRLSGDEGSHGQAGGPGGAVDQAVGQPREEVTPDNPPAPGEPFIVYRLGSSEGLANRNAGNADAVARFIMGTEDPTGPVQSAATTVYAYKVTADAPFGAYEGLRADRAAKSESVGRVSRGKEVAYSFPEKGYTVEPLGQVDVESLRARLADMGHEGFDGAGTNIGAQVIREELGATILAREIATSIQETESPAVTRGGAVLPPPRGGQPAEAAGPTATPLESAAQEFVERNADMPLVVGTNPDGTPMTKTAKQYLEDARADVAQAREDVTLFEAAAQCLLGGGG